MYINVSAHNNERSTTSLDEMVLKASSYDSATACPLSIPLHYQCNEVLTEAPKRVVKTAKLCHTVSAQEGSTGLNRKRESLRQILET